MIKCFDSDITEEDKKRVLDTLNSKVLAFGPRVTEFEQKYKKFSKKEYNIGCNSASSAAYLLFQYLYETLGKCRVYTTSLTFVSPAAAAIKNGHQVVYVDVDENLLMSVESLGESFVRDDIPNVVMPVLYGGTSKIPGLYTFCKNNDCILAVDSAHCVSPTMNYDYAFYSFHPVKPVCMSNGGVLATDNKSAAAYIHRARNFGRQPHADTYDLVQYGFNFYMNNLNASLGLSQLERCMVNTKKRKENYDYLQRNFPKSLGRFTFHDNDSSYYLCTLVLKRGLSSVILRERYKEEGVLTSFHYPPLHRTKYFNTEVYLPVTDDLEDRVINLPIHQNLKKEDLRKIISIAKNFLKSKNKTERV